ncbi:M23 family metallopeptidase [Brunnivagina elsteri]|uniref:Peptidase M23 n=1 Tax=Brunnivagina elsteri CCALA 953 TaxID=987040 RepID=A0A2A2TAD5_9CYAN|nr:M23 family metallopeptidase [Calothrix elsteri]PAX45669.1 peptidase M23 [Calothrix elsteri CCALA 953]
MKNSAVLCLPTYGLFGLILTVIISISTPVRTQTINNSQNPPPKQQATNSTSNLIYPAQGIVSQGFRKYQHEGIDIANASGTPILAAAGGKVIQVGWDDWGLGNVIKIQHPDGRTTVYGHNRRILVNQGQQVNQGQIIAEMGSTGNSSAPHLHFEVHTNGIKTNRPVAVNPILLLRQAELNNIASNVSSTNIQTNTQQNNQVKPIPTVSNLIQNPSNANRNNRCNGKTLIAGETTNARVQVCQENGQLFYIGELKQNPNQPVKLPAWNINSSQYRADNGSFSYFVSPEGIEVWRNGSRFRRDIFYTNKS